jgi:DNA replicative helicase MCM subunit Mcm2 (Cdc46/Mcm family)
VAVTVMEHWLSRLAMSEGLMDIDMVMTGVGFSQRETARVVLGIVQEMEVTHRQGAHIDAVLQAADVKGIPKEKVCAALDALMRRGSVWTPERSDTYRTLDRRHAGG